MENTDALYNVSAQVVAIIGNLAWINPAGSPIANRYWFNCENVYYCLGFGAVLGANSNYVMEMGEDVLFASIPEWNVEKGTAPEGAA